MLCVLARTFKIIINHACEAVGIVRGFALHINAPKSEIIHFVDIRWGKIHLKIATKNDSLKNLCQNGQCFVKNVLSLLDHTRVGLAHRPKRQARRCGDARDGSEFY